MMRNITILAKICKLLKIWTDHDCVRTTAIMLRSIIIAIPSHGSEAMDSWIPRISLNISFSDSVLRLKNYKQKCLVRPAELHQFVNYCRLRTRMV